MPNRTKKKQEIQRRKQNKMGLEKDIRKKAKKGNTREVAAHEKHWFSVLT